MTGIYQTKQREIVLACLKSEAHRALSARDIFVLCKQNKMPVGLTTIYRQLESLAEEHKVIKLPTGNGKSVNYQLIEANAHPDGFFLKCEDCGKMLAADCGLLDDMKQHMNMAHGFAIDAPKSLLYGHCAECK